MTSDPLFDLFLLLVVLMAPMVLAAILADLYERFGAGRANAGQWRK